LRGEPSEGTKKPKKEGVFDEKEGSEDLANKKRGG